MKGALLDGQVALVTGGGKGIGRAIALALAARGARVVVTGRSERALGEVVGEIAHGGGAARHLAGDVRDASHVRAAVARAIEVFGRLDIAIANAGIAVGDAREIIETGLLGAHATLDAALAAMTGPGRLVVVSRVRENTACRASNAGVVGLVRALAIEARPRGVTCNALSIESPAEPEAVADVALMLCSRAADTITGQAIVL
jgi:NAD(P)-dependent dehydrogenase (short-subunit alcohol dehydrogenase family)